MNKKQIIINLISAGILIFTWQSQLHGASSVGKVFELFGKKEELKYTRQAQTGALVVDAPLYYNDGILTGSNSSTRLLFEDPASKIKAAFYVFEDSKFTLDKEVVEAGGKKITVKHTQGALSLFAKGLKKSDELQIVTPHATLGVRGSEVHIEAYKDRAVVWVKGQVYNLPPLLRGAGHKLLQNFKYTIVDGTIKEKIPYTPTTEERRIATENERSIGRADQESLDKTNIPTAIDWTATGNRRHESEYP